MAGFNYNSFKAAIKRVEEESYAQLQKEITQVKAFVEKALTLFLESSSNISRVNYQGIDL